MSSSQTMHGSPTTCEPSPARARGMMSPRLIQVCMIRCSAATSRPWLGTTSATQYPTKRAPAHSPAYLCSGCLAGPFYRQPRTPSPALALSSRKSIACSKVIPTRRSVSSWLKRVPMISSMSIECLHLVQITPVPVQGDREAIVREEVGVRPTGPLCEALAEFKGEGAAGGIGAPDLGWRLGPRSQLLLDLAAHGREAAVLQGCCSRPSQHDYVTQGDLQPGCRRRPTGWDGQGLDAWGIIGHGRTLYRARRGQGTPPRP